MYKDLSLKEKAKVLLYGGKLGLTSVEDIAKLYDEAISYLQGSPIVSPYGQWKYPGRDTIIPSNNITMDNVNYPVLGISDAGDAKVMMPWNDYKFKGFMVYEHPLVGNLALEGKRFNNSKTLKVNDEGLLEYTLPEVTVTGERIDNDRLWRLSDWYHRNAKYIPKFIHRGIYNTIKDSAFTDEPLSEIRYNLVPNLIHNKAGAYDNAFLMSPKQLEEYLKSIGYNKSNDLDYGLVNKAVLNYKNATGREVPIYQYGKDDILRSDLIPLRNNIYGAFRPLDNFENEDHLGDIGAAPYRLYRDKEGNLFYKRWDFFDHGDYSRNSYNASDDEYVVPALTTNSLKYGNILDNMGNPYVKTTGYTRISNPIEINHALSTIEGVPTLFDNEYKNYIDSLIMGKYDYSKGGSIHIKPENRGKFTTLKKRTGHSASWFKAHGTPALKKMATFALNSRHWKHDEGGHLFLENGWMNTNLLTLFDKYGSKPQVIQIDKPVRLNEVLVTADAPKPGDFNYDKYIANTYDAWQRRDLFTPNGDVDINTLPTETRNRVRGYSGSIAALKGMDTAAKVAGITAAIPAGIIGGISFAPTAWSIMNNPIVDAVLTTHGAITAPKNIKEGVQELQEGNYGRGALDLGLTALDLYGAGNLAFRLGRIANPAYRAKHAYNTIAPASYKNMSKRGYEWLKDLWNNPSIDYSNPKWYLNLKEQPFLIEDVDYLGYTKTGSYLPEDILHAGKIADEARIDAWALYNRLPLQYGTYIKNADGTYSYNMKKIMLDSEGTWHPLFEPELSGEKSRMHDFVTGAGGGLTDFRLIESGNHGNGIMHLEDVWDLNPFSRVEDTFQHRLANKAIEKLGSQTRRDAVLNFRRKMFDKGVFSAYNNSGIHKITYPIDRILNRYRMGEFAPKFKINDYENIVGLSDKMIHDLSNSRFVSKISNKLNDFEIGRISGGKPFKMSTDIPYHKRGLDDYLIDSDMVPSIKTQEDLIDALINEPLRYGFNPNWIAYTQPIQSKYFIEPKIDILNLLNNIITKK